MLYRFNIYYVYMVVNDKANKQQVTEKAWCEITQPYCFVCAFFLFSSSTNMILIAYTNDAHCVGKSNKL